MWISQGTAVLQAKQPILQYDMYYTWRTDLISMKFGYEKIDFEIKGRIWICQVMEFQRGKNEERNIWLIFLLLRCLSRDKKLSTSIHICGASIYIFTKRTTFKKKKKTASKSNRIDRSPFIFAKNHCFGFYFLSHHFHQSDSIIIDSIPFHQIVLFTYFSNQMNNDLPISQQRMKRQGK